MDNVYSTVWSPNQRHQLQKSGQSNHRRTRTRSRGRWQLPVKELYYRPSSIDKQLVDICINKFSCGLSMSELQVAKFIINCNV